MRLALNLPDWIRQSDPQQLRRLGNLGKFFGALLLITLIARGTSGATMPVVTLQAPTSGSVERSLQLDGTVSYADGEPFTVPSGLLVTGVPVQVGQQVKAGDALAADHYRHLSVKADSCIGCGHCNSRCPFHVDQVARMETIAEYFAD